MLEMASLGAKVMQPISVHASMIDDIQVKVRSTFSEKDGTIILLKDFGRLPKKYRIEVEQFLQGGRMTK